MSGKGFNYVLTGREYAYWYHVALGVRSWYRGEIRARAKRLAKRSGNSDWAIFTPNESALERSDSNIEEEGPSRG